jgi:CHAD domain-containing protein
LLLAELDRQRRKFRKKALRGIKSLDASRVRRLAGKIERDLSGQAAAGTDEAAIRRLLLRRLIGLYRTVILLRKDIDPANVETIHRVRIAFKKLRYTIEPVRELLAEFKPAAMRDMKSLQEALGSLQDTDVYLKWLDQWMRKQPEVVRPLALFRHCLLCQRPKHIRASIEWLDRLPADWQGGPLVFAPEPSARNRNGSASPSLAGTNTNPNLPARSEAPAPRPARRSPRKSRKR